MAAPLLLADDLSGAAEAAAALGTELGAEIFLWPDRPTDTLGVPVVLDLDSRHLSSRDAAARVAGALASFPDAAPLFKKIDSLLRGNVAAEVAPLLVADALVALTPALPKQGRTVVGGVLLDHGVPLDRTTLWTLEATVPPTTVAATLNDLPVTAIPLATVRSAGLADVLADAAGTVAVCDAETQEDLDAIVAAGLQADPGTRFVGSSDLARALGPHLACGTPRPMPRPAHPKAGGVLMVLGTGAEAAVEQADVLLDSVDAIRHRLPPDLLAHLDAVGADEVAQALASDLAGRTVVVQIGGRPDGGDGASVVAGLARLVAATLAYAPDWPVRLMLSGGQTARAVLDALDCHHLSLLGEIHPGAVLTTTERGWLVATRPGSHGGTDSLVLIHQALSNRTTPTQEEP